MKTQRWSVGLMTLNVTLGVMNLACLVWMIFIRHWVQAAGSLGAATLSIGVVVGLWWCGRLLDRAAQDWREAAELLKAAENLCKQGER